MRQSSRVLAGVGIALVQVLLTLLFFGHWSLVYGASDSATPAIPYVRLSRAFFEKSIRADLKLIQPSGTSNAYSSSVSWVQYPPVSPASSDPKMGQVLADFSDFVACAEMTELGDARLCFKVMGDVSNLGLNDHEMSLRGIQTIPSAGDSTEQATCSSPGTQPSPTATSPVDGLPPSRYQIQKAVVSSDTVELDFKYTNGCGPNVQLTLTQLP